MYNYKAEHILYYNIITQSRFSFYEFVYQFDLTLIKNNIPTYLIFSRYTTNLLYTNTLNKLPIELIPIFNYLYSYIINNKYKKIIYKI